MHKFLIGITAPAALLGFSAAAQAECFGNHKVTASAEQKQETTAASTAQGPLPPSASTEQTTVAQVALCADGKNDCADATKSSSKD